jgi:hypothetical protein
VALSVLSIFFSSYKQALLQETTCIPHSIPTSNNSNNNLLCTRKLAVCSILESISMLGDEFDKQMRREIRTGRKMLIPLLAVSEALAIIGVVSVMVGRKEEGGGTRGLRS